MRVYYLRPANQTTEVPEIHLTAQRHSYKDETRMIPSLHLNILIFVLSSLQVEQQDAAGEAHH